MRKLFILLSFSFCLLSFAKAQTDTLTVMQYNLLNYNNYTSYCTASNNNVSNKDTYIKAIVDYVLPDIFTVCEMNQQQTSIDRLLTNVMNTSGRTNYAKGPRTNYSSSDMVNMVYYNTDKLVYSTYTAYPTDIRDINSYTFYYKDPNLAVTHDTAWITCIIMHLKAGSTTTDADERAAEVTILMNQLNAINKAGNYLVMGDFNTYSSSEDCYQLLVDYPNNNVKFYDPISKPGDWNNNCSFAAYHTQSTRSSSNDCMASGGLDDRFDHILASLDIISGGKNVKYISGTYKALGNDGNHCNDSINQGTNTSVPSSVLNALYGNSDHLPVIMKLQIDVANGIDDAVKVPFDFYIPSNSAEDNAVLVSHCNGNFNIEVMNVTGSLVYHFQTDATTGYNTINLAVVPKTASIAFFRITSPDGNVKVYRTLR
ncbi:hypothetical protein SDC9_55497 [bioreactor metagenome]|uniref:Endonuclease/exonuclease/phosphatase domain-containing protein n=1 Tax=bioreactor metagenome TaxID=1076179 RepID=A0A644WZZ2_9ZZZZ